MNNVNWSPLSAANQIGQIVEISGAVPCVIFKHSTRCSISSLAQHRLEGSWLFDEQTVIPYFVDIINDREVSNLVASYFGVPHESPQLLLIKNGRCVYHTSHLDISVKGLQQQLANTASP